ncbi:hypothetical protein OIE13_17085 [Streptosporangium sp. NBC_01810]|uniref:hypothetical protein n=1 Tax=Streptosporangium sp. NBC_01810 TaxID=2975951 RepID=UPI002DDB82C4|nr:hypothetical protein [Streptosporangium sp. NBC_01810]WSA29442.1 hypothetical protein OIE13_17085 [Streptosporangium sp. NBC_01810]
MHGTKLDRTPPALPVNLRTRSTGTVHAATADGTPLCPTRVTAAALEFTSEPVSCRSCLKLHSLEVVEHQEQPAADESPAPRETGVRGTVRTAEGIGPRVYPGENVAELLDTLKGVQRRGGLPVDGEVVSRAPGGVWELLKPGPAPSVSPCPPWCRTDHVNGVDVEHESGLEHVDEHTELMTGFRQDPGGPVLIVLSDDERSDGTLTLEQAEHLAAHLQTLITAARTGARSS